MIAKTLFALLAVVAIGVEASIEQQHDIYNAHSHKRSTVNAINKRAAEAQGKMAKRCKPRSTNNTSAPAGGAKVEKPASTKAASSTKHAQATTTKKASPPKSTSHASTSGGAAAAGGVIKVQSNACGGPRATKQSTKTGGPNGNIDWLTCGLTSGGWNPPNFGIDDLVTANLNDVAHKAPFSACSKFLDHFNSAAAQHGVPAILLASIALQESSCNQNTVGGNGEQGLMQITAEKCTMGPGAACRDPEYNINTGAKYLVDTLNNNKGNILLTIGEYNGWSEGMTQGSVSAMKKYGCDAQQNMDYLQQVLNGFLQGLDPYSLGFGKWFNLQKC